MDAYETDEKVNKNKSLLQRKWWVFALAGCALVPISLQMMKPVEPADKPEGPIVAEQVLPPELPVKPLTKEQLNVSPGQYLSSVFARSLSDNQNAAIYIQKALSADPKNVMLKEQLYHVLLVEGKHAEAIKIAGAIKDRPHHRSMAAPLLLAINEVKQEQYASALPLLAAKDMKGNLNALMMPLMTAWVKIGAGMVHTPLHAHDVLGKDDSLENAFITYHLALMNDLLGHEKEAADYYAKSLHDPEKTPFRLIEAAMNFYLRTGRTEEYKALVASSRDKSMMILLARDGGYVPGNSKLERPVNSASDGVAELLYSMGSILYSVNAIEDEFIYLRLALYLKPQFPAAQYLLAGGLEQNKDILGTIATYAAIDKKSPLYFRGQIRSAEILFASGKKEQAYSILTALEKNYSELPEVLLTKADLLRDDERFSESAQVYSRVIDAIKTPESGDWLKYYSRGIVYERSGQWNKAEADFNKALVLEPEQPDVLNYLGYSLLSYENGKNLPRAKALIQRALEQRPDDMHIVDSMGWALYMAGEFDQALSYMEQAVELAPNDPTVMDHLGDVYFRLGRKKEARFQWERALVFKPDEKLLAELNEKIENGLGPFVPPESPLTAEDHGKKVE